MSPTTRPEPPPLSAQGEQSATPRPFGTRGPPAGRPPAGPAARPLSPPGASPLPPPARVVGGRPGRQPGRLPGRPRP